MLRRWTRRMGRDAVEPGGCHFTLRIHRLNGTSCKAVETRDCPLLTKVENGGLLKHDILFYFLNNEFRQMDMK